MMNKQAIQDTIARSSIYRVLSVAFLYPDEGLVSSLKEDFSLINAKFSDLIDGCGDAVKEALTTISSQDFSLNTLHPEYRQIFGHTISRECPPYETEYGSAHLFQQAQRLGDIAGFYRAFGLEVSDRAKERVDHITVELEFMGFLSLKEAYALTHHGEEKASICREAQQKFLEEHLGRWVPLFSNLLRHKAPQGFYRHVVSLLEAFIRTECRRLEAKPFAFQQEDVSAFPQEPEGGCFSCGIEDLCFVEPKEET